ncbi:MAG: DsbE family thiol:disulfide interchange protein [Hyphomicrobiaceae bacterium]|nr:DsbE family thiol:disulfide interchange protein [Hyphomicrobiaceae bacterium]
MTTPPEQQPPTNWLRIAPVVLFLGLAAAFAFALRSGDPSKLPSALLGKPAPTVAIPAIEELTDNGKPVPGIDAKDLASGAPVVVNFWASWCAPCVAEHPLLIALKAKASVAILGVNYKDQPSAARRFLGRYGNPFAAVGADTSGRAAIEWGVYGMPETFVLDGKGRIVYKHVGPLTPDALDTKILPAINAARAKNS